MSVLVLPVGALGGVGAAVGGVAGAAGGIAAMAPASASSPGAGPGVLVLGADVHGVGTGRCPTQSPDPLCQDPCPLSDQSACSTCCHVVALGALPRETRRGLFHVVECSAAAVQLRQPRLCAILTPHPHAQNCFTLRVEEHDQLWLPTAHCATPPSDTSLTMVAGRCDIAAVRQCGSVAGRGCVLSGGG